MNDSNKILKDTFDRIAAGFGEIADFRRITVLGRRSARDVVEMENAEIARAVATDPSYRELFTDADELLRVMGGESGFSSKVTEFQVTRYDLAVDSASLIFAHSIVDAALYDLCRATAYARPEAWEPFVEKRTFAVAEIKGRSFESLLIEKIGLLLIDLERKSMMEKADQLFRLAKPTRDFEPIKSYAFDRERLSSLDQMRNDVVHVKSARIPLPQGDEDILFLRRTVLYFVAMVSRYFGVRIIANPSGPKSEV